MKAQPSFAASTFDVDRLLLLVDGDIELLAELREIFVEDSAKILAAARQAVAVEDRTELWRCAHSLKGAVGNFAASEAVALAFRLESESKTGELATCEAILSSLAESLDQLMIEVGNFLRELGSLSE